MPRYDFLCTICNRVAELMVSLDNWDRAQTCGKCGSELKRLISPTNAICDIDPYLDDNMSERPVYVKSRQHRNQMLKERGLSIK